MSHMKSSRLLIAAFNNDKSLAKPVKEKIKSALDQFKKQANTVKSRVSDGKPATAEMRQLNSSSAAIVEFASSRQLPPAAGEPWSAIQGGMGTLRQAFGIAPQAMLRLVVTPMKTAERHELKHNEVADTLQETFIRLERNRSALLAGAAAVVAIGLAWGAYTFFTSQRDNKAGGLLAQALVIAESQVVPPIAPAPGQSAPPAAPNTFPSETARLEAAVPKFLAAADAYPSTQAGIAARFQAAAGLATLGKTGEARTQYDAVIAADGRGLYGRMARLGVAEIDVKAKQFDPAIATLRELSLDARGDLPVDAILVQLAQAYAAAGKKTEAHQALTRVTTEFATSPYAADAKKLLETLKVGA
jgi:hypothetical protein